MIYTLPLMDESPALLQQQAITAALSSNWEEALRLNQLIIDNDPKNVEALNRIGRAYFETGNLSESQNHFEQALKSDPYNQIAAKFLKRIETFSKKGCKPNNHNHQVQQVDSDLFIEEPGKTKIATLLKVAEPQKLSLISTGTMVNLVIKNRGVAITDPDGEYLGILPDDLSHRLIRFLKGGNKYQALVKTVKINGLSVLIRETYRSTRFKNQPSFSDNLNATFTYSSDHIIIPQDSDEDSLPEGLEEEESI